MNFGEFWKFGNIDKTLFADDKIGIKGLMKKIMPVCFSVSVFLTHLFNFFFSCCSLSFLLLPALASVFGGSQGVGVKPQRSAGLVALALKGLWVVGSDPGQA